MYNWRLLLLALVAIFQPITSFTERNLVDGRQECCGRQSDSLLRDSKSPLHGTHRLAKETSPFRRVTDRGDTREDRRYAIRQRDTVLSRGPTDRSHPDINDETGRKNSITGRSGRVEYRSQSVTNDEYRDRRLGAQRRVRDTRNIKGLDSVDSNLRNLNRNTRDSALRLDDRTNLLSSRNIVSRDDSRIRNNYQIPRDLNSWRERMQLSSGNLRRVTPTRDARDNARYVREDSIDVSDNKRRESRIRIMTVRRESLIPDDLRSYIARERRDQTQRLEQRRSLSDNVLVERNYEIRENSRYERHENRDRNASSRRLISERIEGNRELRQNLRRSREQMKENTDRRLSGNRMQLDRRDVRNSRQITNINFPVSRSIESRRDIRYHGKLSTEFRESRVDSGRSRRTGYLNRDMRVMNRRARSSDNRGVHNIRDETDHILHRSNEVMQRRDESRRQIEYRNKMENRERDSYDARLRNVEAQARQRELVFNKVETESESGTTNWKYMLYTLQAVYLCGLLVQLLTPNHSKKSSLINVHWWPMSSQERIKVD